VKNLLFKKALSLKMNLLSCQLCFKKEALDAIRKSYKDFPKPFQLA
jgi:hypothetical protein